MAAPLENASMAVFCDFENVALGVRDAKYEKFDIKPVLERLLLKGSIVVKKAYCDWDRYKTFKATMHEANFELIEIPHVRQSGKNSADIRLVVDALDLCYTKSHVNTFVIISGDSDFSPLVAKLRENAKQVIGVGVKQSTSDLLIANCDEFIFYDDLVREIQRAAAKRDGRQAQPAAKPSTDGEKLPKEDLEARKSKAIDIAVETFDALVSERGDSGKIWASTLKQAIKRRKPDFNEAYFGFRAFGNLLDEAQARGLLELGRDEKSGTYVYRSSGEMVERETRPAPETSREPETAPVGNELGPSREPEAAITVPAHGGTAPAAAEDTIGRHETRQRRGSGYNRRDRKAETVLSEIAPQTAQIAQTEPQPAAHGAEAASGEITVPIADAAPEDAIGKQETRRRRRDGRKPRDQKAETASPQVPQVALDSTPATDPVPAENTVPVATPTIEETIGKHETRRRRRDGRKLRERKAETVLSVIAPQIETQAADFPARNTAPVTPETSVETLPPEAAVKPRRKPAARSPRPRKTEKTADGES